MTQILNPKPKALRRGPPPMATALPVRRYSIDEYHRMIEAGVFSEDDRFELLKGWIIPKMSIHPPHAMAVSALNELIGQLKTKSMIVRVQDPVTLPNVISEPEPDVVLATGSLKTFSDHHPHSADILLLIEVADSSLATDQGLKQEMYAQARVVEYWIVNLVDCRIEVYTEPTSGKNAKYHTRTLYYAGQKIPVAAAGKTLGKISVNDILP